MDHENVEVLYERFMMRANRLGELKKINAPYIIIKNEIRLIKDALKALAAELKRDKNV